MEFPHFVVHRGDARAYRFSITRIAGFGGVGSLASWGPRAVAAVGVPRCAGLGARPAVHARAAVFVGGAAGDRDPGDRGGHARLRRVRDLGAHRPRGGACRARGAVSPAEREDVQVGVVASGRGRSGPAVGGVFHGARGRAGRCGRRAVGGRIGRQEPTRCTPRRSRGRASGVGSPTAPGSSSGSSQWPRRATRSPAYESFSGRCAGWGCR